eukprot:SRR837773.14160.p1 GENE.SRR837773.14160~~SRR837773.14160.p1  ORF type:complete len:327 (-),score=20.04 SRR837773.14160:35-946(-)
MFQFQTWLCTRWILNLHFGEHEIHLYGFILLALSLIYAFERFVVRPSSSMPAKSALDFLLPNLISFSGVQRCDGRFLAGLEIVRLAACSLLALPAPGDAFWANGWPPHLPNTPAANTLLVTMLKHDGEGAFLAINGLLTFSAVFACLHSLWTVYLLSCSSSPAAQHLCGLGGSFVANLDDAARDLVKQRRLHEHSGALSASTVVAVKCGDETLEVQLIGQTPFGCIKFLALSVAPMLWDAISDILSARNYMSGGHLLFGTWAMTIFCYTAVREVGQWLQFGRDGPLDHAAWDRTDGFWGALQE